MRIALPNSIVDSRRVFINNFDPWILDLEIFHRLRFRFKKRYSTQGKASTYEKTEKTYNVEKFIDKNTHSNFFLRVEECVSMSRANVFSLAFCVQQIIPFMAQNNSNSKIQLLTILLFEKRLFLLLTILKQQ